MKSMMILMVATGVLIAPAVFAGGAGVGEALDVVQAPEVVQAPDIVTSWITRLMPAERIGSQSTSPPTSAMSSSIRCRVEAIVNSRTGSAT